jgi:hypothetical protein
MIIKIVCLLTILFFSSSFFYSQTTTQWGPDGFVKIENNSGGFVAPLQSGDRFSREHDVIGDVDGDGVLDIVVGARSDDDGATDAGAVYILFMNHNGTVRYNQKISMLEGDFTDTLTTNSFFGYGVAGVGDYNGDGIPDIAVSANHVPNGVIYILHLDTNGKVKNFVKNLNIVSQGLSAVGDLDGDGRIDIVACNPSSNAGGNGRGAIKLMFFNQNSRVDNTKTVDISSTQGGFGIGLENGDGFGGREVAMLGDIDGDGNKELAVGAFSSDSGKGAIWILSLDATTFNVNSKLKITGGISGFTDTLWSGLNSNGTYGAALGHALCAPGDLNGDGVPDIITGANQQDEGHGYILYLNSNKTVKTYTKINNTNGGFGLVLAPTERFSRSISFVGDLRGDGTIAVNIGGGAGGTGTLYLLFLKPCSFVQEPSYNHWSGGNTLFTNWNHTSQTLTSDSLTFEQCTFKAFETDAAFMTYNFNDGRCICKDSTAVLTVSTELSTAYINNCYSGLQANSLLGLNKENQIYIYPNPTNSIITINTNQNAFAKNNLVTIYSLSGELMYSRSLSSKITTVDLSGFPKGVYVLNTTINGRSSTSKVVVF